MSNSNVVRKCPRTRSKRVSDVDLNALPDQEGPSNHTRSHNREATQGANTMPQAIDVEALDDDDDVIISSPREFAQAKNNNTRRKIVVDLESDERPGRHKGRRVPANQTVINCDLYISLDGSSTSKRKSIGSSRAPLLALPPAPPPPPKEPTFSCPICMGTLVEETSTKCGHIFCKKCIKAAIAIRAKCPTCVRKTTARDIFRIYLPSSRID